MGASETCLRRDERAQRTDSACAEVCRSMVTSRLNLLPPPLLPSIQSKTSRRRRWRYRRSSERLNRLLLTRRRSTGIVWRASGAPFRFASFSTIARALSPPSLRSIDASRRASSKLKTAERGAAPDETSPSSYHHRDPERIFPTVTRRQQRCRNSVAVIKLHGGFGDRGANDHRLRELGSRLCRWAPSPPVTVPG
jgi:hypothetical protein